MKTKFFHIVILLTNVLLGQNMFESDRIYIKFEEGVNFEIYYENRGENIFALTGILEVDELNLQYNCTEIERLFVGTDAVLERWYVFYLNDSDLISAAEQYRNLTEYITCVDLVSICEVGWEPNDPLFNSADHKAFYDSKIPQAWDIEQGTANLKIGIIDNGLNWNHPDIAIKNIWQNLGEDNDNDGVTLYEDAGGAKQFDAGDLNGIDDDGNGEIDDLVGYNFHINSYNIYSSQSTDQHGLNMFGIIAATENNSKGAAGSSFNSKIVHCVAGSNGYIQGNWVQAIQYLGNLYANVISMSFFGAGNMQSTQDVINYAYGQGSIIVACGGYTTTNCPINSITYPIGYDNVIGLGVLENDANNMRLSSRVSSKIDLLGSRTASYPAIDGSGQFSYGNSMHTSGTTTLTAGIISLLKAHYPTWSNDQIVNQLFLTALNKEDYNHTNTCNFNFTDLIGHGLVDAHYALTFNGTIDRDLIWNKDLKIYNNIVVQSGKILTIRDGTNLIFQPGKTFNVYGNLVVEGDLTINQNIIIQSSGNIEIAPGANINFSNGSSLIINGTLTANGTSSNKVTFDFIEQNSTTSNGINVIFGGTISLSNAIVKNAYKGIKVTLGGQPSSIQNSTIQYCRDGIFIQYGNKDADLTVEYCEIKNNSNYGICIFNKAGYGMNSEPVISNNNIESCNYGVYLNGNVGAVIQNCTVENCTQGIYIYNGQPSIFNNAILNPLQNGIYCNAPGKSPLILDNTITKENNIPSYHNYQGIWMENNTAAYIAHNDISGFCWGIYCGGGVNSYFSDYRFNDFYPNNRMRDNLFGFAAGWGSYIYAGREIGDGCWNNSIYANGEYDVVSYQHSYVMAQYNYWGGRRPNAYVDETSELYADEILERDPWRENKLLAGSSKNPIPIEGENFDIDKGILLEKNGQINEAVKHYKQMISKNSYAGFALTELAKFRKKYSVTNLQNYFGTLITSNNIHKVKILRILAAIHLDENRYDEAMQVYHSIIAQFSNSRNAVYARFEKYYAALNHASALTTAF